MKRVAKAFTLFIASSTYAALLLLTATSAASFFIFREPDTIKQWLDDSGVYNSVVDEVSGLATIQQQQENSLVQITAEDIQAAAKQTFTAESLEKDAEGLVDGFYGWFKGDTTGPVFTVDFSGRQASFATVMTMNLEQKINALPECATTGRFTVQAFDPFKADCRPKGVDLTEELSSFEQELANSTDILPQVVYTGDDVKVNRGTAEPQRIGTAFPWVPKAYKGLIWAPLILGLLTAVSALIMIFFSTSRRKGLRRFSSGLLFTGVVLVLSGIFLRPAFERLNSWSTSSLGAQASFTQNVVDPIFREINESYSRYSVIFGTAYIIPAILSYGMLLITRPKKLEADEENEESESSTPHSSHITPVANEQAPDHLDHVTQDEEVIETPSPAAAVTEPSQQLTSDSLRPSTARTYTRRPPMIQG